MSDKFVSENARDVGEDKVEDCVFKHRSVSGFDDVVKVGSVALTNTGDVGVETCAETTVAEPAHDLDKLFGCRLVIGGPFGCAEMVQ